MNIPLYKTKKIPGGTAFIPQRYDINVRKKRGHHMYKKSQLKRGQFSLKPGEVSKIINAARTPRDRIIIELLYYCGLRRSEVVAIQPGDLDLELGRLRVRGKGGKERLVPVPGDVCADIRFYLGKTRRPYLFPAIKKRRAPIADVVVNRILARASMEAGISHPDKGMKSVNPHLLRHSAARRLKAAGVPLEAVGAFLGHDSLAVTANIYGCMSTDEIFDSVSGVLK